MVRAPHRTGRMAEVRLRNAISKSTSVSGSTRHSAARVSRALIRRRSALTAASPVQPKARCGYFSASSARIASVDAPRRVITASSVPFGAFNPTIRMGLSSSPRNIESWRSRYDMTPRTPEVLRILSVTALSRASPSGVRGSGAAAIRNSAILANGDSNCCCRACSTREDSLPFSLTPASSCSLTRAAKGSAARATNIHPVTMSHCRRRENGD